MALVLLLIIDLALSRFIMLSSLQSHITGVAPTDLTAEAVAMNVCEDKITSSPL